MSGSRRAEGAVPRHGSWSRTVLAFAVGAAVLGLPGVASAEPGDGLVHLPTVAGVEAVAVPVSGPDARPMASGRVDVHAVPERRAFEAAPGFGATVEVPAGEMIGVEWNGAPTGAVQVRARTPQGWSDWTDLAADPDSGPDATSAESRDAGHSAVGPIWTGSGTTGVQVQVVSGRLADLRVQILRTSGPQAPQIPALQTPEVSTRAAAAPAVNPRSAWGAGPWQARTSGCGATPPTSPLKHAVVHHTAGSNTYGQSEVDDVLRGIYSFHTQTQGWCDIAYNFLVDRFGGVWEGRTNSLHAPVIGGHAKGFNTGSVGVSLIGNYETAALPEATFAGARRLLAWRLRDAGVDPHASVGVVSGGSTRYPSGRTVVLPRINGHIDTSQTACPGVNVIRRLPELRRLVGGDILGSGPFDSLPHYTPASGVPAVQVADGWGGMHPAGAATPVRGSGTWTGWNIVRDVAGIAGEGYVLDAFGGVHPYGAAPPVMAGAYWPGQDLAVAVGRGPHRGSGYVLDAFGGIHPFGPSPAVNRAPRWSGWRIARDIAAAPGGTGGYVLDGLGGVHAFGTAPAVRASAYWAGWDIARAVATRPDGPGGYVLDGFGGLHAFGGAPAVSAGHYVQADVHRDLVVLPGNRGYVLDAAGQIWPFNGAPGVTSSLTWPGADLSAGLVAG